MDPYYSRAIYIIIVCTINYTMKRKDTVITSFTLYLSIALILGLYVSYRFSSIDLLGYSVLVGFFEWGLLYLGYMLPRMRGNLAMLPVWIYVILSGGVFLFPLLISVLLYKYTL